MPRTLSRQKSLFVPDKKPQIHPSPKCSEDHNGTHFPIYKPIFFKEECYNLDSFTFVELPDKFACEAISQTKITNAQELVDCMMKHAKLGPEVLKSLDKLLSGIFPEIRTQHFFAEVLPFVQKMVKSTHSRFEYEIPILRQQVGASVTLSQEQICCILANSFFCVWGRSKTEKLNHINASCMLNCKTDADFAKLASIINYFDRMRERSLVGYRSGNVTFERRVSGKEESPDWSKSDVKLDFSKDAVEVIGQGMAIEDVSNALHAVFAKSMPCGNVLANGSFHQEEITCLASPELIAASLFVEEMEDNEVVLVTGAERFCAVSGYKETMRFAGNCMDTTGMDMYSRRCCQVAFLDALDCKGMGFEKYDEFVATYLSREMNKIYSALSCPEPYRATIGGEEAGELPRFSTGQWGCGLNGGNKQLKALLQIMACRQANRKMSFMVYDDLELKKDLENLFEHLTKMYKGRMTIRMLFNLLGKYGTEKPEMDLFSYLKDC